MAVPLLVQKIEELILILLQCSKHSSTSIYNKRPQPVVFISPPNSAVCCFEYWLAVSVTVVLSHKTGDSKARIITTLPGPLST